MLTRIMYVSDCNADVDHVESSKGNSRFLSGSPTECSTEWNSLPGPRWFFHRTVRSEHNTSAPDILIEVPK